jgi:hypothetical protein
VASVVPRGNNSPFHTIDCLTGRQSAISGNCSPEYLPLPNTKSYQPPIEDFDKAERANLADLGLDLHTQGATIYPALTVLLNPATTSKIFLKESCEERLNEEVQNMGNDPRYRKVVNRIRNTLPGEHYSNRGQQFNNSVPVSIYHELG